MFSNRLPMLLYNGLTITNKCIYRSNSWTHVIHDLRVHTGIIIILLLNITLHAASLHYSRTFIFLSSMKLVQQSILRKKNNDSIYVSLYDEQIESNTDKTTWRPSG